MKVITQGPTPISDFKFTTRINNALQRENIHTIEELCARSAHNLLKVVGISRKSIEHIRHVLSFKGLHLKGDLPDDDKQGCNNGPGASVEDHERLSDRPEGFAFKQGRDSQHRLVGRQRPLVCGLVPFAEDSTRDPGYG
jgi:hypothetical protein